MPMDASAAQRKTADNAPTLALTGSRPPPGDYLAPEVRIAEDASAAQRKTADNAPTLALTGSRPPSGDYFCPWSYPCHQRQSLPW